MGEGGVVDLNVNTHIGDKGAVQEVANEMNNLAAAEGKAAAGAEEVSGNLGLVIGGAIVTGIAALTAGVIALGEGLSKMVAHAAAGAEELHNLELVTGLGADKLQSWALAAKEANVSIERIATGAALMEKKLQEGADIFGRLGLNVKQLKAEEPGQIFDDVMHKIDTLGTHLEKVDALQQLFGRAGARAWLPLLDAMKGAEDHAQKLAVAMSGENVEALTEFDHKLDDVSASFEAMKNHIAAAIIKTPELVAAFDDLLAAMGKIATWVRDNGSVITQWLSNAAKIAKFIAMPGVGLGEAFLGSDFMTGGWSGSSHTQPAPWEYGPPAPSTLAPGKDQAAIDALKARQKAEEENARLEAQATEEVKEKAIDDNLHAWNNYFSVLRDERKQDDHADRESWDEKKKLWHDIADEQRRAIEMASRIAKAFHDQFFAAVDQLADAFDRLSGATHGFLQSVAIVGAGALRIFTALHNQAKSTTERIAAAANALGAAVGAYQSGSFLKGAAGGAAAGAAFGVWGAAIGGVVGGLLGLFGKKKPQEDFKALREEGMKTFSDLQTQINTFKADKLTQGISGLAAMFKFAGEQADLTQDRITRLGDVGVGMFQALKDSGMSTVEAMKALGPALDQAIQAANDSGLELTGTFGMLADFREKVLANQDLVNAIDGWAQAFDGLNANGMLTVSLFDSLQKEVGDYIAKLEEAGFTHEQIIATMLPDLFRLYQAEQKYGFTVDDTTQKLIDEAAAGHLFDGMEDPLQKLVELQGLMLQAISALVHAFGVDLPAAVQKYINSLNQVPALPGSPGAPGGPRPGQGGGQQGGDSGGGGDGQKNMSVHVHIGDETLAGVVATGFKTAIRNNTNEIVSYLPQALPR